MAETVRAAVKVGVKETEIREFPMPDIPIDGALLKVEAAGICGSDVSATSVNLAAGPISWGMKMLDISPSLAGLPANAGE